MGKCVIRQKVGLRYRYLTENRTGSYNQSKAFVGEFDDTWRFLWESQKTTPMLQTGDPWKVHPIRS